MKAYIKINNDLSINGKKYKLGKTYLDNFKLKFYENISDIFHDELNISTFDLSNSGIYEVEIHDVVRTLPKKSYEAIYFTTYKFVMLKEFNYSSIKLRKKFFQNEYYKLTINLYKNFKSYNLFEFLYFFKNNFFMKTILFKAFFYNISKKDVCLFEKEKNIIEKNVIESQKNVFFNNFPEKYHDYLINSDDISDKFLLIDFGKIEDLDYYLQENDIRLTKRIIEKGRDKDLDLFVNNKFKEVRIFVAKNCRKKDLLILKNDKSKEIRNFVKSILNFY